MRYVAHAHAHAHAHAKAEADVATAKLELERANTERGAAKEVRSPFEWSV